MSAECITGRMHFVASAAPALAGDASVTLVFRVDGKADLRHSSLYIGDVQMPRRALLRKFAAVVRAAWSNNTEAFLKRTQRYAYVQWDDDGNLEFVFVQQKTSTTDDFVTQWGTFLDDQLVRNAADVRAMARLDKVPLSPSDLITDADQFAALCGHESGVVGGGRGAPVSHDDDGNALYSSDVFGDYRPSSSRGGARRHRRRCRTAQRCSARTFATASCLSACCRSRK